MLKQKYIRRNQIAKVVIETKRLIAYEANAAVNAKIV